MSKAPGAPIRTNFAFETDDTVVKEGPKQGEQLDPHARSWETAVNEAAVLLRRMDVPEPLVQSVLHGPTEQDPLKTALGEAAEGARRELRSLLVQHAADTSQNVLWYQGAMRRVEARMRYFRFAVVGVSVTILVPFGALAFHATDEVTVDTMPTAIAQVSLFGTLFFGLLKALAAGTNLKKELTAFWQARSDLKEALFTFAHSWRGRLRTPEELCSPDFNTALYEEMRNARLVVRTERTAFFEAFSAPEDILPTAMLPMGEASAAASAMATARAAVNAQKQGLAATTATDIAAARTALIEAKANVAAKEAAIEMAEAEALDTSSYKLELITARAEVERASKLLRLKLKVDRLNPN